MYGTRTMVSIFRGSKLPYSSTRFQLRSLKEVPELPEIAHLNRCLEPVLSGAVVREVTLLRPDIVGRNGSRSRRSQQRVSRRSLLMGERIEGLARHGKQLAIVSCRGPSVCVHLGMSGQLWHCPAGKRLRRHDHVHCVWHLDGVRLRGRRRGRGRLVFRDPRRFGGLWCFSSLDELTADRWSHLGPDALSIDARTLRRSLARTQRSIKAALLDQHLVAGIGNIYADEILFAAGLHPQSVAARLPADRCRRLAHVIRHVLALATTQGGSTIRDYVDGQGRPGSFSLRHQVYGRATKPCTGCGKPLRGAREAQRATVFCPLCQDLF